MPGFFQNGDPIKMRFFKIFCFIFGKKNKIRKKSLVSDKKSVGCATKTLEVSGKNVCMDMDLACYGTFWHVFPTNF